MASNAYLSWFNEGLPELDRLREAHQSLGGHSRGRRYVTLQINYAYTALLCGYWQAYCRNLHTECVTHLAGHLDAQAFKDIFTASLMLNRELDKGNPHPGTIRQDFSRLGLSIWAHAIRLDKRNEARRRHINTMVIWRNAVVHQDFKTEQTSVYLKLSVVEQWRTACCQVAQVFDRVMRAHLRDMLSHEPWPGDFP